MEDKKFKTGTVMDMVSANDNFIKDTETIEAASDAETTKAAVEGGVNAKAEYFRRTRTVVREYEKIGRNDPCPCGSGKKYKNCCLKSGKYENHHELTPLEMSKVKSGEMQAAEVTKTA